MPALKGLEDSWGSLSTQGCCGHTSQARTWSQFADLPPHFKATNLPCSSRTCCLCCSAPMHPSGLSHVTQVFHPFLFTKPVPPLKKNISMRVTKRKTKQVVSSELPFHPSFIKHCKHLRTQSYYPVSNSIRHIISC